MARRTLLQKTYLPILSALTLIIILLISPSAYAIEPVSSIKGLTVTPLRTELSIAPGTSETKSLSITNTNTSPITVHLTVEEFSVINEQYDYAFDVETQLSKWVTFTPSVLTLEVGQTKDVSYTVGVPFDAEPGGRYISMFASTETSASGEGAQSIQRVGSLLYITVLGDVSRAGTLISLNSPWFITGPADWSAQLANTGTTHYRSRYTVAIQNLFGGTEASSLQADALVLPSTVRAISGEIPTPKMPGIYKIVYTIGLGDSPAKIETRYVLYMPSAVLVIVLFAAILAGALFGEYRSRKKRQAD